MSTINWDTTTVVLRQMEVVRKRLQEPHLGTDTLRHLNERMRELEMELKILREYEANAHQPDAQPDGAREDAGTEPAPLG